jgi:hypothetical protein
VNNKPYHLQTEEERAETARQYEERQAEERRIYKETFIDRMVAIGKRIGWPAVIDEESYRPDVRLVDPRFETTGRQYRCHQEQNNRVRFYGCEGHLGRHRRHGEDSAGITVSLKRSDAEIAGDLNTRMYKQYTELLRLLRERQAEWDAEQELKRECARRLVAAANGRGSSRDNGNEYSGAQPKVYYGGSRSNDEPCGSAEISTYRFPHAKLEIDDVPIELAEQIIRLVADWRRPAPAEQPPAAPPQMRKAPATDANYHSQTELFSV